MTKHLLPLLALLLLLTACHTARQSESSHTAQAALRTDTLRIVSHTHDTLLVRDSISTDRTERGCTITIRETRWRTQYATRTHTDTLYQSRTDTLTRTEYRYREREVEKRTTPLYKLAVTVISGVILAALIAVLYYKIRNKWKW